MGVRMEPRNANMITSTTTITTHGVKSSPSHPGMIQVDCPDCLNASRNARRQCKKRGGMCKGTGVVWKRDY